MIFDDTIMDELEAQEFQAEQDALAFLEGEAFTDCCLFIFQALWMVAVGMAQIVSEIVANYHNKGIKAIHNAGAMVR